MSTPPVASLSLDLDDKWTYLKTHGDKSWESLPSYLDVAIPRVLDFLRARGLSITFMIVGQDAALDRNRDVLGQIAAAGHEIGNHSFRHEPWLHLYSKSEIDTELARAEEHIERATGRRPSGFRGPGYSVSGEVLRALVRRGYKYDASTLPTFIGPLARAYYFRTTHFADDEARRRAALFGSLRDGLRPLRPYLWRAGPGGDDLVELPVTTMPGLRTPFHLSYLLWLSAYSPALARLYFRMAMTLCGVTGTAPSLLLHPLDFLGREDIPDLSFFPAMQLARERKLEIAAETIDAFARRYTVRTLADHAAHAAAGPLRRVELDF